MSALDFRFGVHEFAHADEAVSAGLRVQSARVNGCGGVTGVFLDADTDPRVALLVCLAGTAGELAVFGDADPRWSILDLTNAFKLAYDIAGDEEHVHEGPRDTRVTAVDLGKLAALTEEQKAQGIARLVARRGPRAHEIVAAAQEEVLRRLSGRRVVLRHGAGQLQRHGQHLDGQHVAALVAEGLERQRLDDRRFGVGRRQA